MFSVAISLNICDRKLHFDSDLFRLLACDRNFNMLSDHCKQVSQAKLSSTICNTVLYLGAGVDLFQEEAGGALVAAHPGLQLHHPVLLLTEEDEELLLLHGHGLQPGRQGRPCILGQQRAVKVNEGQQAVNLKGRSQLNSSTTVIFWSYRTISHNLI